MANFRLRIVFFKGSLGEVESVNSLRTFDYHCKWQVTTGISWLMAGNRLRRLARSPNGVEMIFAFTVDAPHRISAIHLGLAITTSRLYISQIAYIYNLALRNIYNLPIYTVTTL